MPAKKFPSLLQRASLMLDHSNQSGVKISPYWQGYVENVMLEIQMVGDDIFSPSSFFASTFSGGTEGLRKVPDGTDRFISRISEVVWKPFSAKVPLGIRKSGLFRGIFGPFFTLSVAMRKNVSRKHIASEYYNRMTQTAYEVSRGNIKKHGLKSRNNRTSDDVDIFAPDIDKNIYFSMDTLNRFRTLIYFQGLVDARDKIIVEIGSGIGEMARLYISLGLVRRYILVDIPPALAFSERNMVEEFGEAAVDVFDPDRTSIDLSDGKLVSVLTPDQLAMIPHADIGINEASFGEMAPPIVEKYLRDLIQANIQDFISVNHRLGKPNNKYKVDVNEYRRLFSTEMDLKIAKSVSFCSIFTEYLDDEPNEPGYQLLHFKR